MSENIFRVPGSAECLRNGLLEPFLDSIEKSLLQKGYAIGTVRGYMRAMVGFDHWLLRHQIPTGDLDEKAIDRYLGELQAKGQSWRNQPPALRIVLDHLRVAGVAPLPQPIGQLSPLDEMVERYETYLRVQRGLVQTTVINYRPTIRGFLFQQFGDGPLLLQGIGAADVQKFLLSQAKTLSHGRAKLMTTALRSFFRFLLQHGEIDQDLGTSVLPVCSRERPLLDKFLTPAETLAVLGACDRRSQTGRRNHAILLLLARLGLRAGEAMALNLDDIDWRAGEIMVSGKGQCRERLPLPAEVGEALADYVQHDRPRAATRRVFLGMKAPHRGFGNPSTVSTIVRRAIGRAGLDPPHKGAHALRHGLATGMLRQGASMAEIGQVLRHHSASTTEIYAKVDFEGLRALALPWPEYGGGQ